VRWEDGLFFETDDGENSIKLGAMIRFDGRFAPNDPGHVITDTFLLRQLRLNLSGQIARYFTFRLIPDFSGNGAAPIADAYVDIRFSNALHVRAGRDKAPVGYELLLQDANVLFVERGLVTNLLPGRDVGAQVLGVLGAGLVEYQAGVFNGVLDGSNALTLDPDSSKDVVGRIILRPFQRYSKSPLYHLGVALGGSRGQAGGALPTFHTSLQQVFFNYDRTAVADGMRTHLSPQAFYIYKSLLVFAELARETQVVRKAAVTRDLTNTAWQIDASYLLTGETAGERIHPKHPFDPAHGEWGALQVMARVGVLDVDPEAFAAGLADPASNRRAAHGTIGAAWHMTTNFKMLLNYERTVFDRLPTGTRYAEHGLMFRMQMNF
jgi:phosphate-selective porin OprO/OprP